MIQNIDDGQQETHATDTVSETPRWTIINISQSAVGFHILRLCTQDKVISNIDIYDHVVVDRDNAWLSVVTVAVDKDGARRQLIKHMIDNNNWRLPHGE